MSSLPQTRELGLPGSESHRLEYQRLFEVHSVAFGRVEDLPVLVNKLDYDKSLAIGFWALTRSVVRKEGGALSRHDLLATIASSIIGSKVMYLDAETHLLLDELGAKLDARLGTVHEPATSGTEQDGVLHGIAAESADPKRTSTDVGAPSLRLVGESAPTGSVLDGSRLVGESTLWQDSPVPATERHDRANDGEAGKTHAGSMAGTGLEPVAHTARTEQGSEPRAELRHAENQSLHPENQSLHPENQPVHPENQSVHPENQSLHAGNELLEDPLPPNIQAALANLRRDSATFQQRSEAPQDPGEAAAGDWQELTPPGRESLVPGMPLGSLGTIGSLDAVGSKPVSSMHDVGRGTTADKPDHREEPVPFLSMAAGHGRALAAAAVLCLLVVLGFGLRGGSPGGRAQRDNITESWMPRSSGTTSGAQRSPSASASPSALTPRSASESAATGAGMSTDKPSASVASSASNAVAGSSTGAQSAGALAPGGPAEAASSDAASRGAGGEVAGADTGDLTGSQTAAGPEKLNNGGGNRRANRGTQQRTIYTGKSGRISVSSGVMASNLLQSTAPKYPRLASLAHVQGPVVLQAIISRAGFVDHVHVIKGHYLLRRAATDAVRKWRYRPYQLNGAPVEVATIVTVDFGLNH